MILSAPDKQLQGQENRINKLDMEGTNFSSRRQSSLFLKLLSATYLLLYLDRREPHAERLEDQAAARQV